MQQTAGGAIGAFYNETFSHNVVVKNCRFINNDAEEAAGALGIYGNNSKVINCTLFRTAPIIIVKYHVMEVLFSWVWINQIGLVMF